MAQPTVTDVHLSVPLTNISIAYIQGQDAFIASDVFRQVPVEKQTNKYYKYTKADWFRDEAKVRADATESAGSGYGLTSDSYSCDVFALHKDIGDQVRANADSVLNMDRDATQFLTQRMLLRQELQFVTDAFATSIWATDVTPSNLWSSFATSDPISDVETGKRTILLNTGMKANTLVLGYDVYIALKQHPDIIDRIKYTSGVTGRTITPAMLAAMFDVERVLVASAVQNSAVEGETAVYAFTHGKHALLCYVAPNPGLLTPSAGYTFTWSGVSSGMGKNVGTSKMRMEWLKADRIEVQMAWDNKIVATDLGYFFASVVA